MTRPRLVPLNDLEAVLGPRCVNELKAATPQPADDIAFVANRFVINPGALLYWVYHHFGLDMLDLRQIDDMDDLDELSESVTIRGVAYRLPHWCYLGGIIPDPGDERPTTWPGLPHKEPTS